MIENAAPPSDYASPEYKAQVELRLARLQNDYRLAIHQWENAAPYVYPIVTANALAKEADTIPAELESNPKHPLLSMSLLPAASSGVAMIPYQASFHQLCTAGYLIDLDQNRPHPARVVRVHSQNLDTGPDTTHKNLRMACDEVDKEFQSLYAPYDYDEQKVREAAAHDPQFTEKQLQHLGASMEKEIEASERYLVLHNEILVAAGKQHIAAITIPVFDNTGTGETPKPGKLTDYGHLDAHDRDMLNALHASLLGLAHLKKGIDVPVVFYPISGEHAGHITYFAQGKELLTAKAMEAYHALKDHGFFEKRYNTKLDIPLLRQQLKDVLGVEIAQHSAKPAPLPYALDSVEHQGMTQQEAIARAVAATWGMGF